MENPIDNYILGGGVPVSTGFEDYGDTIILNESKPIVIEENVFTENNPQNTSTDTEESNTSTNTEDTNTKLNNPTQNFMSNANPFLIGIGVVVGLVLLGDFFKSKSE